MTAMTREQTARQWLLDEAQRQHTPVSPDPNAPKLLLSPASWVLPKLLRIVYQNTHQPVEALAPLIREMLHEQVFASTCCSPCDDAWLEDSINESVAVLVGVLERARDELDRPGNA